jgi:hypothetical protein
VQIADSFKLDEKYPIFTTPGGDLRLPQDTDESFKEAIEELAEQIWRLYISRIFGQLAMLQTLLLTTESGRINGLQMFIMSSSHSTGAT